MEDGRTRSIYIYLFNFSEIQNADKTEVLYRNHLGYLKKNILLPSNTRGLTSQPILYHTFKERAISSRPEVFCKKGVLKNFTKFTGKHLCQSLIFIMLQAIIELSAEKANI